MACGLFADSNAFPRRGKVAGALRQTDEGAPASLSASTIKKKGVFCNAPFGLSEKQRNVANAPGGNRERRR